MNNNRLIRVNNHGEAFDMDGQIPEVRDFTESGIIFGRVKTKKRGLFMERVGYKPFMLDDRKILQHIMVIGKSGSGAESWMMEKAGQAMHRGWTVWYLDFNQTFQSRFYPQLYAQWKDALAQSPFVYHDEHGSSDLDLPMEEAIWKPHDFNAMLESGSLKNVYLQADVTNISAVHRFAQRRLKNEVESTRKVWFIMDGLPVGTSHSHEENDIFTALYKDIDALTAQCRAAQMGLMFHFSEQPQSSLTESLRLNVRTTFDFYDE